MRPGELALPPTAAIRKQPSAEEANELQFVLGADAGFQVRAEFVEV
jgi:hypothetical protein